MLKPMYSIRDVKAETWALPFSSINNATAIRDFQTLVSDGRTLVGQHPEDFDLFFVGSWDEAAGAAVEPARVKLANGLDFKKED